MGAEEIELRQKQKEIENELKIKQLHGETLDELSLLAEQICYKLKADRVECAELLNRALTDEKSTVDLVGVAFKELATSVSAAVKELVQTVPV